MRHHGLRRVSIALQCGIQPRLCTCSPRPDVFGALSAPLLTLPVRSLCKSPSLLEPGTFAFDPPRPLPRGAETGFEDPRMLPRPRPGVNGVARPPLVELPPRWPRVDGADIDAGVVDQHRKTVMSRSCQKRGRERREYQQGCSGASRGVLVNGDDETSRVAWLLLRGEIERDPIHS